MINSPQIKTSSNSILAAKENNPFKNFSIPNISKNDSSDNFQKNENSTIKTNDIEEKKESAFKKTMDWLMMPVETSPMARSQTRLQSILGTVFLYSFIAFMLAKGRKLMKTNLVDDRAKEIKNLNIWQDLTDAQKLEDMALPEGINKTAKRLIKKLSNPQNFFERGGTGKKTVLLYGPPGTGKTTFAKAIAKYFPNSKFASIDLSTIEGKYVGESQNKLNNVINEVCKFATENPDKEVFVFFDEIDSIAMEDNGSFSQQYYSSLLNVLKKGISEKLTSHKNITVVAATNVEIGKKDNGGRFLQKLAKSIIDRFDEKIEVANPTASQLQKAISHHYRNARKAEEYLKVEGSEEVRKIAKRLEERHASFRTLESLYNAAASSEKTGNVTYQDIIEAIDSTLPDYSKARVVGFGS